MKNLILFSALVLFGFSVQAQRITKEFLVGYWEPNKHATQLVFWKDVEDRLQVIEFSTVNGAPLRLLSIKLLDYVLVMKTIFDETNWTTECTYRLIDENNLECTVKGGIKDVIIYTKVK